MVGCECNAGAISFCQREEQRILEKVVVVVFGKVVMMLRFASLRSASAMVLATFF